MIQPQRSRNNVPGECYNIQNEITSIDNTILK